MFQNTLAPAKFGFVVNTGGTDLATRLKSLYWMKVWALCKAYAAIGGIENLFPTIRKHWNGQSSQEFLRHSIQVKEIKGTIQMQIPGMGFILSAKFVA